MTTFTTAGWTRFTTWTTGSLFGSTGGRTEVGVSTGEAAWLFDLLGSVTDDVVPLEQDTPKTTIPIAIVAARKRLIVP